MPEVRILIYLLENITPRQCLIPGEMSLLGIYGKWDTHWLLPISSLMKMQEKQIF